MRGEQAHAWFLEVLFLGWTYPVVRLHFSPIQNILGRAPELKLSLVIKAKHQPRPQLPAGPWSPESLCSLTVYFCTSRQQSWRTPSTPASPSCGSLWARQVHTSPAGVAGAVCKGNSVFLECAGPPVGCVVNTVCPSGLMLQEGSPSSARLCLLPSESPSAFRKPATSFMGPHRAQLTALLLSAPCAGKCTETQGRRCVRGVNAEFRPPAHSSQDSTP